MKKYSGQAIAIIMVILVVAAVIGASLYSRMIRNKGEIIDTRESSKALEQSGNILDAFITTDIRDLQETLYSVLNVDPYKIEIEGTGLDPIGSLKSNIDAIFGADIIDINDFAQIDASCSKYKMSFEFAPPSEGIVYDVGDVMAINLSDIATPPAGCNVDLTLTKAGSGDHIFTVKKVLTDGSGGYKPYELNDMLLYCLPQVTGTCPQVSPFGSIAELLPSGVLTLNMNEANLNEIRVLPLKEKIKIGIEGTDPCGKIFHQYLIKATSFCSDQERTMQVVIPSITNYGYSPMFDYTIYNSNGALSPVVIP